MTITPAGVGRVYGYARVSTTDQNLEIQTSELVADGVHPALIFKEKRSGTSRTGRVELDRVMALMGPGDILTVTRLDRLGRSLLDLVNLMEDMNRAGTHLRVIHQPVDTTTATGRAFMQMLGVFAEFETCIRRERQAEGIAKAKQEGRIKGRPPSVDKIEVARLHHAGKNNSAIARELGCHRASVIRVIAEMESAREAARQETSGISALMRSAPHESRNA